MLLTLQGVARHLGIGEKAARQWVANIPAIQVGKRRRWRVEEIDAAVRRASVPAGNPVAPSIA